VHEHTVHRPEEDTDSHLLHYLDYATSKHLGTLLPGEVLAAEEVQKILSHLQAPGIRRNGLPPEPEESAAQRSAARNQLYPFALDIPVLELERLLMLDEFEALLAKVRPEKKCSFKDRVFHERIPKDLLCQVLFEALSDGRFIDTSYIHRHDSLLIALYHRALPGQALWHLWTGDHLGEPPQPNSFSVPPPCTTPSYNDWLRLASRRHTLYNVPKDVAKRRMSRLSDLEAARNNEETRSALFSMDAREYGYCRQVEKHLTPADGSVIQQTSFRRGLAQALGKAGEASAGDPKLGLLDPNPEPAHEATTAIVQKNGVTFGIITDNRWEERVRVLREEREAREQKEREEAEAAAAAEAEAKAAEEKAKAAKMAMGMIDPDPVELEEVTPVVEEDPKSETEVHLEELKMGTFWVAFKDGARCTARVHHEAPWIPPDAVCYDSLVTQPGMVFTYTMLSGLTIQVASNGSVTQCHSSGVLQSTLAQTGVGVPEPGCPDDIQAVRTITPFGSLCIELLSGRVEVYHADGTRSLRNPTLEELQKRHEEMKLTGRTREARFLAKLVENYLVKFGEEPMQEPPKEEHKKAGLPGHWRIARPDGRLFGRVPMPPPPPPGPTPEELAQMEEERLAAEAAAKEAEEAAAAEAAKKKGGKKPEKADAKKGGKSPEPPVEEEPVEEEPPPPPPPPPPTIDELIPGVVVDDGAILEYEIGTVSATTAVDPHTWQLIHMHGENMLRFSNEQEMSRVNICLDQTRMSRTMTPDGHSVKIEKVGLPVVSCSTVTAGAHPLSRVQVSCPDGTEIEVVPRRVDDGQLSACCLEPSASEPAPDAEAPLSTNASVTLRRKDGATVHSRGSGEVDIATNGQQKVLLDPDATINEEATLKNLYTAHCHHDKITVTDSNGSTFDVYGNQSATVAPAGVEEAAVPLQSPRCLKPSKAYGLENVDGQLDSHPKGLPEPRLFVVYGDGEAEELLLTKDVKEVLRLAKADPACAVVEGEPMGAPMEMCRSHSIYRTIDAQPDAEHLDPLAMPPIIEHRQRALTTYSPPPPSCMYMQWRNFVEYPPVTEKRQAAFRDVLRRYHEWEERFRREH